MRANSIPKWHLLTLVYSYKYFNCKDESSESGGKKALIVTLPQTLKFSTSKQRYQAFVKLSNDPKQQRQQSDHTSTEDIPL
jgi:hypothetical protein